jgi:hypothetical protein
VETNLTLEWRRLGLTHAALVFDAATWHIFAVEAEARGLAPTEMITRAVTRLVASERLDHLPADDVAGD